MMKPNLKTFPSTKGINKDKLYFYISDVSKWKRDFEASLSARCESCIWDEESRKRGACLKMCQSKIIPKELLGDE